MANFFKHASPFLKEAIRKAKRTWKGKPKMSEAKIKKVKALQAQRKTINARIRKEKGK